MRETSEPGKNPAETCIMGSPRDVSFSHPRVVVRHPIFATRHSPLGDRRRSQIPLVTVASSRQSLLTINSFHLIPLDSTFPLLSRNNDPSTFPRESTPSSPFLLDSRHLPFRPHIGSDTTG